MLSRSDARLAEQDTEIPAMDILLDPDDFATWLAVQPGNKGVVAARCHYLRYKPGVRLLAGYEVRFAGGEHQYVHAWGIRRGDLPKLEKEMMRPVAPGFSRPGRILCPSRWMMVEFYPNDRRLSTLAVFADPNLRQELINRRIPECAGRTWSDFTILSYKPERRFVGVLADESGPGLIARGYTSARFRDSLRAARVFRSGEGFRIPDLRGFSRSRRVLLMEWMKGDPLAPACWNPAHMATTVDRAGRIGGALAELHLQPARRPGRRSPRRESRGLRAAARGVDAVLAGKSSRRARRVARDLKAALSEASSASYTHRPIHGDFHPEQILIHDEKLALIDLDRADLGDPLSDLATFMAHVDQRSLEGRLSLATASDLEEALLKGYLQAGGRVAPGRYAVQRAASLLRLAPQPFRERSSNWPELTRALVDRARRFVADGPRNLPIPEAGAVPR